MTYQVLARKWRPKSFADVVGQEATVTVLRNSLISQKLHHAYLFTGTRGVGKTTIARILASALVCQQGISPEPCNSCDLCQAVINGSSMDVIEIDAASRTKVEDTRAVLENLAYHPNLARFRIYIIDEVHMLSGHSFNALLKTLEEPPAHVKFLLATTDPQKLPITVLSRCLQFKLNMFTPQQISQHLAEVLTREHKKFEPQALWQIAMAAKGSIRDGLSLLEQVVAFTGQLPEITYQDTCLVLGVPDYLKIIDLLTAIINSKVDLAIDLVQQLLSSADPYVVLQELQLMLKNINILQLSPQVLNEQQLPAKDLLLSLAQQASLEEIQLYYEIVINGFKNLAFMPDIRVGFEMIILRMLAFKPIKLSDPWLANKLQVNSDNHQSTKLQPNKLQSATPTLSSNKISVNIDNNSAKISQDFNVNNKINNVASAVNENNSEININRDNFIEIVKSLKLSGLTKQLAEHLVFGSIECNVSSSTNADSGELRLKLWIADSNKIFITEHNTANLRKAFSNYLSKPVKLLIDTKDFSQHPELQQQTIKWQQQVQAENFVTSNKEIEQLAGHFDGEIAEIQIE